MYTREPTCLLLVISRKVPTFSDYKKSIALLRIVLECLYYEHSAANIAMISNIAHVVCDLFADFTDVTDLFLNFFLFSAEWLYAVDDSI